jgi:hypothetical protein
MHFIEHIIEPTKLLMVWQSPDDKQHHRRYVVAELTRIAQDKISLTYLVNSKDFQQAKSLNFKGYPAFPFDERAGHDTHDIGVLDALMRRLPPRTRNDFSAYLEGFRIKPGAQISDFALLGYSGAKLLSDGFSIVNPFEDIDGPFEFLLEAAGYKYQNVADSSIAEGMSASFVQAKELHNGQEEDAIKIFVNEQHIGYVTRALLPTMQACLNQGRVANAWVEKKNGTPGQPVVYLYVKILSKV